MSQDIIIRILLLPIALLYGLLVSIRHLLYQVGILRSVRFNLPVISVGNLSVGGAGKSPHIEYLLRWLDQYIEVAVLSRGYGRKTVGYRPVTVIDTANEVGDEPLQFKRKFPGIPISVSESRALGVPELVRRNPATQCVLLDDAFQHLAITPGLNILLTEYNRPYSRDWLLPSGRLREWRAGARRADIVIVTKCPTTLSEAQRQKMAQDLDLYPRQRLYFSYYEYQTPYALLEPSVTVPLTLDDTVLLVSAIANTDYLMSHLATQVRAVHAMEFADHHYFTDADLQNIAQRFEAIQASNKVIVTTEKDATRFELHTDFLREKKWPIFVLPVAVAFHNEDEAHFRADVQSFLLHFKV